VIAPSGAWPSVPAKTPHASAFVRRVTSGASVAHTARTSVPSTVKNATMRFENSTYEW
jgi:hypothetical protein